ncbi:hypothetical protein VP01_61g2 [Puccinia sorghi]|uniref:Uncharacterized protein n=1 Tax=Puccinia sorghi TaxID=27349 RepID=A0A0L6UGM0_9BASI|nr:hypothetical protein VP01_61g2 [Puccinia sorghi]
MMRQIKPMVSWVFIEQQGVGKVQSREVVASKGKKRRRTNSLCLLHRNNVMASQGLQLEHHRVRLDLLKGCSTGQERFHAAFSCQATSNYYGWFSLDHCGLPLCPRCPSVASRDGLRAWRPAPRARDASKGAGTYAKDLRLAVRLPNLLCIDMTVCQLCCLNLPMADMPYRNSILPHHLTASSFAGCLIHGRPLEVALNLLECCLLPLCYVIARVTPISSKQVHHVSDQQKHWVIRSFHVLHLNLDITSAGLDSDAVSELYFQAGEQINCLVSDQNETACSSYCTDQSSAEEPSLKSIARFPDPVLAFHRDLNYQKLNSKRRKKLKLGPGSCHQQWFIRRVRKSRGVRPPSQYKSILEKLDISIYATSESKTITLWSRDPHRASGPCCTVSLFLHSILLVSFFHHTDPHLVTWVGCYFACLLMRDVFSHMDRVINFFPSHIPHHCQLDITIFQKDTMNCSIVTIIATYQGVFFKCKFGTWHCALLMYVHVLSGPVKDGVERKTYSLVSLRRTARMVSIFLNPQ